VRSQTGAEAESRRQLRKYARAGSHTAARGGAGTVVASGLDMAIMWDPPTDTLSLSTTPAETTWRIWLVETLAKATEVNGAEEDDSRLEDERWVTKLKNVA
jgi:hypothetical protein